MKYLWANNRTKSEEGQQIYSVTKERLKRVLLEGIVPNEVKSLRKELHPIVGHIHCELFAVYKRFYDYVIESQGDVETVKYNVDDLLFID